MPDGIKQETRLAATGGGSRLIAALVRRIRNQKVELTGFEPATSSSRTKRATSLRYSSMQLSRAHYSRNCAFGKDKVA